MPCARFAATVSDPLWPTSITVHSSRLRIGSPLSVVIRLWLLGIYSHVSPTLHDEGAATVARSILDSGR